MIRDLLDCDGGGTVDLWEESKMPRPVFETIQEKPTGAQRKQEQEGEGEGKEHS